MLDVVLYAYKEIIDPSNALHDFLEGKLSSDTTVYGSNFLSLGGGNPLETTMREGLSELHYPLIPTNIGGYWDIYGSFKRELSIHYNFQKAYQTAKRLGMSDSQFVEDRILLGLPEIEKSYPLNKMKPPPVTTYYSGERFVKYPEEIKNRQLLQGCLQIFKGGITSIRKVIRGQNLDQKALPPSND